MRGDRRRSRSARAAGPCSCTCCSPARLVRQRDLGELSLGTVPEQVVLPLLELRASSCERVVDVEDRRVRLQQAGRPLFGFEAVLVHAGDQRPLLVERGLALDDGGERQHLVEREAALRGDVEPLGADPVVERVEHLPDEVLGRRRLRRRPRGSCTSPGRGSPRARRPSGGRSRRAATGSRRAARRSGSSRGCRTPSGSTSVPVDRLRAWRPSARAAGPRGRSPGSSRS